MLVEKPLLCIENLGFSKINLILSALFFIQLFMGVCNILQLTFHFHILKNSSVNLIITFFTFLTLLTNKRPAQIPSETVTNLCCEKTCIFVHCCVAFKQLLTHRTFCLLPYQKLFFFFYEPLLRDLVKSILEILTGSLSAPCSLSYTHHKEL